MKKTSHFQFDCKFSYWLDHQLSLAALSTFQATLRYFFRVLKSRMYFPIPFFPLLFSFLFSFNTQNRITNSPVNYVCNKIMCQSEENNYIYNEVAPKSQLSSQTIYEMYGFRLYEHTHPFNYIDCQSSTNHS